MKRGDGDFVVTADRECPPVPEPKPAQHAARTVLFHRTVRPICLMFPIGRLTPNVP